MKIYHYDGFTKEYTGSSEARLDPLEMEINQTERWLLPANATFDAPPECPEGKMLVMDNGWKQVDIPAPIIEPVAEPILPTAEEIEAQRIEALIQAKMREQAIAALKAEGAIL